MRLQHPPYLRQRAKSAVERVKLRTAAGMDSERDSKVFTARALAQFNGGGVELRVMLTRNAGDSVYEVLSVFTHHLDGKQAGVVDK